MSSTTTKAALAALVLSTTWTSANADTITIGLDNTAAAGTALPASVDHIRIFTSNYDPGSLSPTITDGPELAANLSVDLGSITPGATLSGATNVSYAVGTSAYVGAVGTVVSGNTEGILIACEAINSNGGDAVRAYLNEGTNFDDVYAAIVNGNATPVDSLFGTQGFLEPTNAVLEGYSPDMANDLTNENLLLYLKGGSADDTINYGDATLSVTPEPASLCLIAAGSMFCLQRRRRRI